METNTPSSRTAWKIARAVLASLVIAYMFVGPFIRESRVSRSRHWNDWKMFELTGAKPQECQVKYTALVNGERVELDRREALGYSVEDWQSLHRRRIENPTAAHRQALKVCRRAEKVPGFEELRGLGRCASLGGWQWIWQEEEDLCRADPPPAFVGPRAEALEQRHEKKQKKEAIRRMNAERERKAKSAKAREALELNPQGEGSGR